MILLCQKRTISIFRMVRNYIRNTSQGLTSGDVIRRAVKCVSTDGLSSPIPIVYLEKTRFSVRVVKIWRMMHAQVFCAIKCIFAKTANLMMTFL